MTDHGRKPMRWANDLNTILAAGFGADRFPVPVRELALEYSRLRFPNTPIVDVKGGALGSFEGALYPVRDGKGWAIIYNSGVSNGRQRFTIAHEFGHFLMHRSLFPGGIECSEEAVTFRDGEELEQEANTFAAYLLMPFDDFRSQLPADAVPALDSFSAIATRYGVSLISCIIRWLEYTQRRAMLVISRDEFILWSRSSDFAFKSGLFYRTRNVPPIAVPAKSLAGRREYADLAREGVRHPPGIWLGEECTEITLRADRYDQVLSILLFDRRSSAHSLIYAEPEMDTYDNFQPRLRTRFDD